MVAVRAAVPGDEDGIAGVQVAAWRDAYARIVPRDFLDGMSEARSANGWRRLIGEGQRTILVAEAAGGDVIGFASGGAPARDAGVGADAELDAIYVQPGRQRSGTGRLLAAAVASAAAAAGARTMVVWVLTANLSGRAFYERLGAVASPERVRDIDFGWGLPIEEMAYRWDDLSILDG
ncbi:MAG TPA: GNAT family N-acetyltransferase [Candidatus Dormibacteraeota bacterium]